MLEVTNLCYQRDERYLFQHLNFRLSQGCALQITGANGSGKTTLLKTLTGLILPSEGDICWQQQSIYSERADYNAQLFYLGHLPGITALLTPQENLKYYLSAVSKQLPALDLHKALAQIGLADYIDTPCYLLSAGQQRRVALARLLLTTAQLWVLDEPLTSLDQQGIKLVEKLIVQHLESNGIVIVTSHQPLTWGNSLPQEISL